MRATFLPILLLLAVAAMLAGCGDSATSDDAGDEPRSAEQANDDDAGEPPTTPTQHVDGTVRLQGASLVLTPNGRPELRFEVGEQVAIAEVKALQASGTTARVTFEPARGDASPVAIDVRAAQTTAGQESYEGVVTKVDGESITVDGSGGERTFVMGIADDHEIEHLAEHRDTKLPVKVFLSGTGAEQAVVAYEDA